MGRVEVRVSYTGNNNRVSVDFEVTAPAGTTVIAHSVSGDVRVTGIRGDVRVDSVSGDITNLAGKKSLRVRANILQNIIHRVGQVDIAANLGGFDHAMSAMANKA